MDINESKEFDPKFVPDQAPAESVDALIPSVDAPAAVPPLEVEETLITTQEEERISIASNLTLVWWRFRKNKLAVISSVILIFLFIVVLIPDFFATTDPEDTDARLAFIPIQTIHWFDEGRFQPWVPGVTGARDKVTLK